MFNLRRHFLLNTKCYGVITELVPTKFSLNRDLCDEDSKKKKKEKKLGSTLTVYVILTLQLFAKN